MQALALKNAQLEKENTVYNEELQVKEQKAAEFESKYLQTKQEISSLTVDFTNAKQKMQRTESRLETMSSDVKRRQEERRSKLTDESVAMLAASDDTNEEVRDLRSHAADHMRVAQIRRNRHGRRSLDAPKQLFRDDQRTPHRRCIWHL